MQGGGERGRAEGMAWGRAEHRPQQPQPHPHAAHSLLLSCASLSLSLSAPLIAPSFSGPDQGGCRDGDREPGLHALPAPQMSPGLRLGSSFLVPTHVHICFAHACLSVLFLVQSISASCTFFSPFIFDLQAGHGSAARVHAALVSLDHPHEVIRTGLFGVWEKLNNAVTACKRVLHLRIKKKGMRKKNPRCCSGRGGVKINRAANRSTQICAASVTVLA